MGRRTSALLPRSLSGSWSETSIVRARGADQLRTVSTGSATRHLRWPSTGTTCPLIATAAAAFSRCPVTSRQLSSAQRTSLALGFAAALTGEGRTHAIAATTIADARARKKSGAGRRCRRASLPIARGAALKAFITFIESSDIAQLSRGRFRPLPVLCSAARPEPSILLDRSAVISVNSPVHRAWPTVLASS